MKRFYKITAIILAIVLLLSAACVNFSAATIFESDGFYYSLASSTTANLHGRESEDADLIIPKEFNEHYVVNIVDSAFIGDSNIETLSFSNAILLERIGYYAFRGCANLSGEVTFGGRISNVGTSAFEGCTSLESVAFRSYVSNISNQCFYNCTSLSNVELNDKVQTIGKYAFANCTSLEYVEIPSSVTSINSTAFDGDENLTLGVWYDSYAYQYAKDNNISYVLLDGAKLGETDGDGSVNINDVTTIQRYLAELETLEGIYLHAADANQDGTVDIADATLLQEFLAEYTVGHPVGEVMTQ